MKLLDIHVSAVKGHLYFCIDTLSKVNAHAHRLSTCALKFIFQDFLV